jgi:tetratricopeptide (TPR) repeat protein
MGLTQLAMGNYDQAIEDLTAAINSSGEYGKEAHWYLGLTYLKTGNKQSAAECFRFLGQSEGYYQDRSAEILRRLR